MRIGTVAFSVVRRTTLCGTQRPLYRLGGMKWTLVVAAAVASIVLSRGAWARPLLHDPVELNIGVNCQWQARCMASQRLAMRRSLAYVATKRPPQWRVQLCNRNAARGGYRVDWIGYDHCIRNPAIRKTMRANRRYANR